MVGVENFEKEIGKRDTHTTVEAKSDAQLFHDGFHSDCGDQNGAKENRWWNWTGPLTRTTMCRDRMEDEGNHTLSSSNRVVLRNTCVTPFHIYASECCISNN
jgi:hypothetical protein